MMQTTRARIWAAASSGRLSHYVAPAREKPGADNPVSQDLALFYRVPTNEDGAGGPAPFDHQAMVMAFDYTQLTSQAEPSRATARCATRGLVADVA
jgi:hypothetical protein